MDLNIRKGNADDLKNIVEAQVSMAKETEDMDLDLETVTKGVSSVLSDESKGTYYVAESGTEFVACLLTVPEWSDWRNSTVMWIHSVNVEPQYRGKKVYKKMYEHLQSIVNTSSKLAGLRLYVDKTNKPAQAVYKKLGMSAEHYDLYEWLK